MEYPRKRARMKALAKQFLAKRCSAAGISYLVGERSRPRRFLWLLGLLLCFFIMGFMSLRVLMEYLKYPKDLNVEAVVVPRLQFPAVTVCPLNPVQSKFIANTSFDRIVKLRKFLDEVQIDKQEVKKSLCQQDLLCTWSWFDDTCSCVPSPCRTEFCVLKNSTHCYCSAEICKMDRLSCKPAKGVPFPFSNDTCVCNQQDRYQSPLASNVTTSMETLLSKVDDEGVRRVLEMILKSKTTDLSDIDEELLPSMEEMFKHSMSFEQLVPSCSFELGPCYRENFTIFYHQKYGKCYMFNYVGGNLDNHKQPITTHTYGSSSGLRLLLRVTDSETLDLVRRDVGARVIVHDPYKLPLLTEYGVNISPLDMTALGVMLTNVSRLGHPWGTCVPMIKDHRKPYSVLACEKQCELEKVVEKCKCAVRKLLTGSTLSPIMTEYGICNDSHLECVRKIMSYFENGNMDCGCRHPCQENMYSFMVTSSKLNERYYKAVKAVRTLTVGPDDSFTRTNVSDTKSLLGLKVYYRSFRVTQQIEEPSYSWETLISNLGGNFGFFMGLTLVTTLEVLEFAFDIFLAAFFKESQAVDHANQASYNKSMCSKCLRNSENRSLMRIYSLRRFRTQRNRNDHAFFCKSNALPFSEENA